MTATDSVATPEAGRIKLRIDIVAGSPELRAYDLMAMLADPTIHAIQCLRGGCGSAQVIPHLDFQIIT